MDFALNQPVPDRIVIATRESRLALWQAEHVQSALAALYPQSRVELLGMSTRGDRILDRPLARIGGKGLFIKELELAMRDGHADLAVHSLKDVPMEMPEGFALAAITARENACDAFVSPRYASLEALPAGAVFGMAISVASTVVLTRVLSDNRAMHTPVGHVAIGWLVVEDLYTILVLVLLPALFPPASASGAPVSVWATLGTTTLKLGALVVFTLVAGQRVIP